MTSRFNFLLKFVAVPAFVLFSCPVFTQAATFSFNGVFTDDDNEIAFTFSLLTAQSVVLQTTSYATGGFAPNLSLFGTLSQANPTLLGQDSGGIAGGEGNPGCGIRAVNPTTGLCLDAVIQAGSGGPLAAGSYLLILTADPNIALGPNLEDGFRYPLGTGTFTGNGVLPGPFVDPAGNQMNSGYSVLLTGVDSASGPAPEPSTWAMMLTGAALILVRVRQHGRRRDEA